MGQYDKAFDDLSKAIELNPMESRAYLIRGTVHVRTRQDGLAFRDFAEAIALTPDLRGAYWGRALVYVDCAEYDKAEKDLSTAIGIYPFDAFPRLYLLIAQQRLGKDGKPALAEFRKTIKDSEWPTPIVRMLLGEITPEQCLAAATHKDAWREKEKKCEAHFYIGEFYLLRGDKVQAARSFKECVASDLKGLTEYWSAKAELERLEKP
jgi:lipoprotein NlpI